MRRNQKELENHYGTSTSSACLSNGKAKTVASRRNCTVRLCITSTKIFVQGPCHSALRPPQRKKLKSVRDQVSFHLLFNLQAERTRQWLFFDTWSGTCCTCGPVCVSQVERDSFWGYRAFSFMSLEIFSDAEWADRQTRRSVTGSTIFFGACLVHSSSRIQKLVSLRVPRSCFRNNGWCVCTWISCSKGHIVSQGSKVTKTSKLVSTLAAEKRLFVRSILGAVSHCQQAFERFKPAIFELFPRCLERLELRRFRRSSKHLQTCSELGRQDNRSAQIRTLLGTLGVLTLSQLQGYVMDATGADASPPKLCDHTLVGSLEWVRDLLRTAR